MEVSLNAYEIKLLRLLARRDRKSPEIDKTLKGLNFSDTTKSLWDNKFIELVHGPGNVGRNTQYRITSRGKIWIKGYYRQTFKRAIPVIISNIIALASLIVSILK